MIHMFDMSSDLQITGWPAHDSAISSVLFGPDETSIFSLGSDGKLEACSHPFFDELQEPNARLPNGRPLPPLFNFKQELLGASPDLINRLLPEHVKRQMGQQFFHPTGK